VIVVSLIGEIVMSVEIACRSGLASLESQFPSDDELSKREITDAIEEYLTYKKASFVEVTRGRLESLDHELARLQQQARELNDARCTRWNRVQGELIHRRRHAWQAFQRLTVHTEHSWNNLAARMDDLRQDLAASLSRVRRELNLLR
jgi:hypothetical protein